MPDEATWYFDPISPYVYLQLPDLDRLPPGFIFERGGDPSTPERIAALPIGASRT